MDLDVIISDSALPPNGWSLTTPSIANEAIDSPPEANNDNKANPRRTKVSLKPKASYLATWRQENLILGGLTNSNSPSLLSAFGSSSNQEMNHRNTTLNISLTESLWNNETHLYAHVRLMRHTYKGDQLDTPPRKEDVLVKRVALTRHRRRKRKRDEKSLLDSPDVQEKKAKTLTDNSVLSQASNNKTHDQILLYMKPSLTLQMVDLGTAVEFPNRQSIPRQFSDHMDWLEESGAMYYPILYVNEFWITYESLKEVNGGLKESKIDVSYEPVAVSLLCCLIFMM